MERIFTYIAAILSRILFLLHAGVTIWWLTQISRNHSHWYIMGIYLFCLTMETLTTVVYRKSHEYYWFCPSIFIFTTAEIPCFGILRMHLGNCLRMNGICTTNATRSIKNLGFINGPFSNDEKIISGLDQTFVLLLVIGRWLLPKGQMSRDQLSQLLLIYIAAAADIVELTEIYEIRAISSNSSIVNVLFSLWSISLLQFSVTIQNVETIAQEKDIEEVELEKQKEKEKNETCVEIQTEKRSNRIAPALYTYKLAQRKAIERQRERRNTMDLDSLRPANQAKNAPTQAGRHSAPISETKSSISQKVQTLKQFEETVQNFIHTHIDLIQLLTPMLLQDGPFLIMRLYLVSQYDTSESNMFLFLIAKNALVVMLQVYRICVLYCRPNEQDAEEDIFQEQESVRLRNVQTAHASMRTATLTVQAVSKFKAKREPKRKRSRTFTLIINPLSGLKRKRRETNSKRDSTKHESDDEVVIEFSARDKTA